MTSVRITGERPYTNPLVKNPTYPTVTEYHQIVEMTTKQRGWKWEPMRELAVALSNTARGVVE